MKLEVSDEQFAAVLSPLLKGVAGELAARLVALVEAMQADRAQGWMDKAEAMLYVGLKSERALETWMKPSGEGGRGMPHVKIGETVKFRRASIERWADGLEKNPAPLLRSLEEAA